MSAEPTPVAPPAPRLGAWATGDGVRFRVWAPSARRVEALLEAPGGATDEVPLGPDPDAPGHWLTHADAAGPGTRYRFRLDGGEPLPDPASRSQPDGVHGPSAVVEPDFAWTDHAFVPTRFAESVFYELHVGTFTAAGTFDAVLDHLGALADLGVTTVELLPVAAFPGARNWGYDGVFPYAVQESYGGLDGLRRLVDAAHAHGLAVCLDVVHNHLGPEGNVLGRYGPYFTDRYRTPWGDALNFDGPGSDEVRAFFIGSAGFFAAHAHVDAFRLDAVHAIVDGSAYPFVEELTDHLHRPGPGRAPVVVVAESASDDPRITRSADDGGWGLDGQWNDDFHHALHVALTGEDLGYYADYRADDLATAYRRGFTHHGRHAPSRGHRLGHPRLEVAPERLVVFSANHDQIGNRPTGDRLSRQVDPERAKAAAALVLLAPSVPLLFMGDEHGAEEPFPYFVSHGDPDLVAAVRAGRAREFAGFAAGGEPPDPQDPATFRSAVLDHRRARRGPGALRRDLHRALLGLRRELRPHAGTGAIDAVADGHSLVVTWRGRPDLPDLALLASFADGPLTLATPGTAWGVLLDTADAAWGGPGAAAAPPDLPGALVLAGPSVVVLRGAGESERRDR